MKADGTAQTRVTFDRGYDSGPSFSPDGSRIVFARQVAEANFRPGTAASAELFIINVDGTGEIRLTHNENTDWEARFSPDGKKIVYTTVSVSSLSFEIWVMDLDGAKREFLARGSSPCFSPDGGQVAFINDPKNDFQYDVFLLDLDTRQIQKITDTGGYKSTPSFSTDGSHLIFLAEPTANGTGMIKILNLSDMSIADACLTD